MKFGIRIETLSGITTHLEGEDGSPLKIKTGDDGFINNHDVVDALTNSMRNYKYDAGDKIIIYEND